MDLATGARSWRLGSAGPKTAAMRTRCARDCSIKRESKRIARHSFNRNIISRVASDTTVETTPTPIADATPTTASTNGASTNDAAPKGYKDTILLQGFGWDSHRTKPWYGVVESKVQFIKDAGFSHVWLPPPSQSVSAEGYLPGQLYNLGSQYGNEEQLVQLTKQLKQAALKPVADIVINHRCADEQVNGVWNKFRDDVDHHGKQIDWGRWAITGNDPVFGGQGNPDTGDDFGAAPDLDHLNPDLRAALVDWMKWLHEDIGFEGWRFDYVKGYGAEFITEYVDKTVGADVFNVGELWTDLRWGDGQLEYDQDNARQVACNWIDKSQKRCTAFDFVTKGVLGQACKDMSFWRLKDKDGKAPGLIGWWPKMAVTFVDNHDTGSSQAHWPHPSEMVGAGYAYILTHPGMPSVFWEHLFTWGDAMQKELLSLIAIRKRAGIVSDSKLEIQRAQDGIYVAKIADKVVVKLGPSMDMGDLVPKESDGWKLATYGNNYAVWEKV